MIEKTFEIMQELGDSIPKPSEYSEFLKFLFRRNLFVDYSYFAEHGTEASFMVITCIIKPEIYGDREKIYAEMVKTSQATADGMVKSLVDGPGERVIVDTEIMRIGGEQQVVYYYSSKELEKFDGGDCDLVTLDDDYFVKEPPILHEDGFIVQHVYWTGQLIQRII